MESKEAVVACSLGADDMEKRRQDWKDLLGENLVERREIPEGICLLLRSSVRAAAELRRLVELENACCGWINWSISEGAMLEVDATADQPQGTQLLRTWLGREAMGI